MATASSRQYGPLSHPVCAIITRVGAFLPILFALSLFWQIYLLWNGYSYISPEFVVMAVYSFWVLLFAVVAAAAGGANRLYQWFTAATPGIWLFGVFLILLLLSPVLDPNRIAVSSYAQYVVDNEYEEEYSYNHLSYS